MTEVNIYRRGIVATASTDNGLRAGIQQPFVTTCECTRLENGDYQLRHNGEIMFVKPCSLTVTLVAAGADEDDEGSIIGQTVSVEKGTIYTVKAGDGVWRTGWAYRRSKEPETQTVQVGSHTTKTIYNTFQQYYPIPLSAIPKFAIPTEAFGLSATSEVWRTGTMKKDPVNAGNYTDAHGYVTIHINSEE